MTRKEAVDILSWSILQSTKYTNEELGEALNVAISTVKAYETISQKLGHLPFRMYEGKEMVDRMDIYDTLNNIQQQ